MLGDLCGDSEVVTGGRYDHVSFQKKIVIYAILKNEEKVKKLIPKDHKKF